MCGIAGVVSVDPLQPVDPAPLEMMLRCLRHRGPDDTGTFATTGVAIGNRRLSIIDVEGGHQPLCGALETTVIATNGEIYNYRELTRQLATHGHVFRTQSDTEVAAHAYDQWGLGFLDRLEGMYALALWDGKRRRLVLARDRLGEKPLFYTHAAGLLIFASELSALMVHPAVPKVLDPEALSMYLALEYVPAPTSILKGVRKVEPGTAVVLEREQIRTMRYWALDPRPADPVCPYREAVQRLRHLLDEAVKSRLVSDVPLGIFLSGGIDSSTVAALAARHGELETFSIGFDERSFDERAYARAVADHIGSNHHERVLRGEEMPDLVPKLGVVLDEPIGDASIVPTMLLSSFAREKITVALTGDGGDELFGGYPMHWAHRVAPVARRVPRAIGRALEVGAGMIPVSHKNFSFGFKVATFLRGAKEPPPLNHARWMSSYTPEEQQRLLTRDVWEAAGEGAGAFGPMIRAWELSEGAPPIARARHLDALNYLSGDILTKVDRASMSVGLETRAPFLARELVEFAFDLPDGHHMRGLRGKRLLRDAVSDLLPRAVLARPKKGFGIPVGEWLNGPLRTMVSDLLSDDAIRRVGLFQPAEVQRLLREHREGIRDFRKPLWTLVVFELWRRAHLEGPATAQLSGEVRE